MMDNSAINHAARRPDDEFYTAGEDISKEMSHYPLEVFAGKVILFPCDGPGSEFVRYFKRRFADLGLARIIATKYHADGKGVKYTYDGHTGTE